MLWDTVYLAWVVCAVRDTGNADDTVVAFLTR